ncbi:MAG TPA: pyrroline-5-carboxylate reductase [Bacillales bacterium]|nr:pyrroline-5-carboxylate reductase [Bacillales bacterium]
MKAETPRILFIGAGRMAEAILAGLVSHEKFDREQLMIANHTDNERLQCLQQQYGVSFTFDWREEVSDKDVILLACPPEAHPEVLETLSKLVDGQFVVSVAAGIGTEKLQQSLPEGTPVAWVMPNTAADIGESISLYSLGSYVTDQHKKMLQHMLAGIGESQACTDQQIHVLTAITGSAPAFIYRFAEILEKAAMHYGISQEQARKLVVQMIYGSGAMLKNGEAPDELRQQVTSPGGATAAGLEVLAQNNFSGIVKEAVTAVNARADEQAK